MVKVALEVESCAAPDKVSLFDTVEAPKVFTVEAADETVRL